MLFIAILTIILIKKRGNFDQLSYFAFFSLYFSYILNVISFLKAIKISLISLKLRYSLFNISYRNFIIVLINLNYS